MRFARGRLEPLAFLWRMPDLKPGSDNARRREAFRMVKMHTAWSVPGGMLPIPFSDVVIVTSLQLRMLARIARLYSVSFSREKGRLVIGALLLGLPQGLSNAILAAMLAARSISVLAVGPGTIAGSLALGSLGATVTFALGQVFIEHFESGGTLLDFDAEIAGPMLAEKVESCRRWLPWLRRAPSAAE
jgi:uncharacterized protein (DUF697 family)